MKIILNHLKSIFLVVISMVLLVELLCLSVKSRLTSGWLHPYLYWFNQGEIPMLVKSRPWPRPEMRKNVAMATLLGREGGLYTAQFAPDGQHVLSPGRDLRGVTLRPFSWDFGAWSNDLFWCWYSLGCELCFEAILFMPFELFDVFVYSNICVLRPTGTFEGFWWRNAGRIRVESNKRYSFAISMKRSSNGFGETKFSDNPAHIQYVSRCI